MLKIKCYGTGSRGNCYKLEIDGNSYLIDMGCNLEMLRSSQDNNLSKIKGIFITHEHLDHIQCLSSWINKYPKTPIYWTKGTRDAFLKRKDTPKIIPLLLTDIVLEYNKPITIDGIEVSAFRSSHDAYEPCGFWFHTDKWDFLHLTDTGKIPKFNFKIPPNAYMLLEANYDPKLIGGDFKDQRTLSSIGHLSIKQALKFIQENELKWVGLIHGSHTTLIEDSDLLFQEHNLKHVERVTNDWEKYWE